MIQTLFNLIVPTSIRFETVTCSFFIVLGKFHAILVIREYLLLNCECKGNVMALPILWLGAAALSALAAKELADDRKSQQRKRKYSYSPETLDSAAEHDPVVAIYPSDLFNTEQKVKPEYGAIVCCGIGGLLDHTGIWVGDDTIIELDGNGLIKAVSSARFTQERSGENIFIACDSNAEPITSELAAERATSQIFQYRDYHVIENNCHNFIWQCFSPNDGQITTFKSLNRRLAQLANRKIYWDLCITN